jgi:uncharacterized protein (DUF433 family)
VELLASGMSIEEIIEDHPDLDQLTVDLVEDQA